MKLKTFFSIYVLVSYCQTFIEATVDQVVCRDNENHPVDWFILYKEPSPNGSDYLIMTNLDSSAHWKRFSGGFAALIGAPALANTFHPLKDSKATYAMYSDQPPTRHGSVGDQWGHAKGVVAKLGKTGILVTHSLPNFPLALHTKPEQGWSDLKGQIFMCITFDASNVHWTSVLTRFSNLVPFKYEHSDDWKQPEPRFVGHIDLFSLAGTKFQLFSKYGTTGKDIYGDIITEYYKVGLNVATWRNGAGGKIPSNCSVHRTIADVTDIHYTAADSNGAHKTGSWKSTKDHSKWAVSRDGTDVFCVGDVNRMESQRKRHGGAVCFENSNVVTTFRGMVMSTECKKRLLGGQEFLNSSVVEE